MKKLIFGLILVLLSSIALIVPASALDIERPQEEVETETFENIYVYDEADALMGVHKKEMINRAKAAHDETNIRFAIVIVPRVAGDMTSYVAQRFDELHMEGGAKESGFLLVLEYNTGKVGWKATPELNVQINRSYSQWLDNSTKGFEKEVTRTFSGRIGMLFLNIVDVLKKSHIYYANTAADVCHDNIKSEMDAIMVTITVVFFCMIIQILIPYRTPRLIALAIAEALILAVSPGFAKNCHASQGSIVLCVTSFVMVATYFIVNAFFGYSKKKPDVEITDHSVGYHY